MKSLLTALRQIRNSPVFSLTVIFTIALGIGANASIFTLIHEVLLRSLPVSNPQMLVRVGSETGREGITGSLAVSGNLSLYSNPLYEHLRDSTPAFEQLAAVQSGGESLSVRSGSSIGKAEQIEYVSGNYFQTLGVGFFSGRALQSQDDQPSAPPVAVISYSAWQTDFGSDPSVVGKTLLFDNHPITVVGVAPSGFYGDRISTVPPAFWIPLSLEPSLEGAYSVLRKPTSNWLYLLGRLKPGTNTTSLAASMTAELRHWLALQPAYTQNGGAAVIARQRVEIVPGGGGIQQLQSRESTGLYLLMSISALVLLVACANVANLLLAWGSAHKADTSLRMALGAERGRLIFDMLLQSVLLALLGGLAGLALAYLGTQVILSMAFPDSPQLPIHPEPSPLVLAFAFFLSLATGIIFGIVPAWITSHGDPAEALRGSKRLTGDRISLPQRSLIVFQAALSLVLLVGASLLTRSLAHLEDQDFGILTSHRYVVHIDPVGAGYTDASLPALYRDIQTRFHSLPEVVSVGLALYSPLEQAEWATGISVDGRPNSSAVDNRDNADFDRVGPQFFESVGQRLLAGRVFTETDTPSSQVVAVVNESFAKQFFAGHNPVGLFFGPNPSHAHAYKIVGLVHDAKYVDPTAKPAPMYFLALNQRLPGLKPAEAGEETRSLFIGAIILHFRQPPQQVDQLVRGTLANINPNLTANTIKSFEYQVNGNFTQNALISRLATLFGLLALVLASIGLYGVTSYQVTRRTSEIGLRMALGASRGNVLLLVLRGASIQVAIGLLIGLPVAMLGARSIASQLYGVQAYDPASLAFAVAALVFSAFLAGLIPARRAATVEPITALRSE